MTEDREEITIGDPKDAFRPDSPLFGAHVGPVAERVPAPSCRDCETRVGPWYWTNTAGQRMQLPRCARCHEDHVRHATREFMREREEKCGLVPLRADRVIS